MFKPHKVSKNPYAVLGLNKDASPEEIKKAYRKMAKENHPDTNPDNLEKEQKFKEAANAYEAIGNEENRKAYDAYAATGGSNFSSSQSSKRYNHDAGAKAKKPYEKAWEDFQKRWEDMHGKDSAYDDAGRESSWENYTRTEAKEQKGNIAKGSTVELNEDTIIVGDIEDNVTLIVKNSRVKINGNIGSNVKIIQTDNPDHTHISSLKGIEVTGSIKDNCNFESEANFKATNLGNKNKINAWNINIETIGDEGKIVSKDRVTLNEGGNDINIDAGRLEFSSLKNNATIVTENSVTGKSVGNRANITSGLGVALEENIGANAVISAKANVSLKDSGDGLVLKTVGNIKANDIGNRSDINVSGSVTLNNAGDDLSIVSGFKTTLNEGGNNVNIKANGVAFAHLKDDATIVSLNTINGKSLGNRANITSGLGVALEEDIGHDAVIDAKADVFFRNSGDGLVLKTVGNIKANDIGTHADIKGSNITLGSIDALSDIASTGSLNAKSAAVDCILESGYDITVGIVSQSTLKAKNNIKVDFGDNLSIFMARKSEIKNNTPVAAL